MSLLEVLISITLFFIFVSHVGSNPGNVLVHCNRTIVCAVKTAPFLRRILIGDVTEDVQCYWGHAYLS